MDNSQCTVIAHSSDLWPDKLVRPFQVFITCTKLVLPHTLHFYSSCLLPTCIFYSYLNCHYCRGAPCPPLTVPFCDLHWTHLTLRRLRYTGIRLTFLFVVKMGKELVQPFLDHIIIWIEIENFVMVPSENIPSVAVRL